MNLFELSAILLTAAALGGYVNHRWIRLPLTIGLMLFAMLIGVLGIGLEHAGLVSHKGIETFLSQIDFSEIVFHGMLSFLLFAGALQIRTEDLKRAKLPVAVTATAGTVISTFLIGSAFYFLAKELGLAIGWLYAFLLGAILSPTDPIAVLAIIKKMGAPKPIETKIAGESLFNDGVAIVLFITLLELIAAKGNSDLGSAALLLCRQAGGGLLAGIVLGWIACRALSKVNDSHIEFLITLAIPSGGYVLAEELHVSAPLAMVAAGLIVGNIGRRDAMSPQSRVRLDSFWELIEEVLNAVLFMLIGLMMMAIKISAPLALLSVAIIGVALLSRYISVAIPIALLRPWHSFMKGTAAVMTWGGLRGALSIAMVLALKDHAMRDLFLPCVYAVVVFSIAVQGLTFGKLLKKYKMT